MEYQSEEMQSKYALALSKYNTHLHDDEVQAKVDNLITRYLDENDNADVKKEIFHCIDLTTLKCTDSEESVMKFTEKVNDFPMTVIGKGTYVGSGKNTIYKYKEVSVSAGDVLRIVPIQYGTVTINEETGMVGVSSLNSNTVVGLGTTVKWTLSYIPTNGIIASGEFEVPYP